MYPFVSIFHTFFLFQGLPVTNSPFDQIILIKYKEYINYFIEQKNIRDTILNYQLSFLDYPEGSVHSDSTDLLRELFASTIDASVESVKGIKKYQTEINQFEYPGYLWKIEFGENQIMKTKAFVAGNRFYTMQVFGDRKYDKTNVDLQFFDSFRFIDPNKINR